MTVENILETSKIWYFKDWLKTTFLKKKTVCLLLFKIFDSRIHPNLSGKKFYPINRALRKMSWCFICDYVAIGLKVDRECNIHWNNNLKEITWKWAWIKKNIMNLKYGLVGTCNKDDIFVFLLSLWKPLLPS